jgi:hypothetical protein
MKNKLKKLKKLKKLLFIFLNIFSLSFLYSAMKTDYLLVESTASIVNKLGIGTTTPTEKLEVNGNIKAVKFIGDGTSLTGIATSTQLATTTTTITNDINTKFLNVETSTVSLQSQINLKAPLSSPTFSGNVTVSSITFNDGTLLNSTTTLKGISQWTTTSDGILYSSGTIISSGIYGSGTDLTISGAGTRMIWYPKKAAFRAGYVGGTQWDNSNIGNYSTAMGYNTTASGSYSTAMGLNTTASGNYSTAMGLNTTASGNYSTAMGNNTTASGHSSTAMGLNTTASGNFSATMGNNTTAQAYGSLVLGQWNVISGTTNNWISTDPIFVIGNGTNTSNRSNALTVLKNGNTEINGALTINGNITSTGTVTAGSIVGSGSSLTGVAKSSSGVIIWTGTQAQYDAIGTKDSNTLYFITE